MSAILIVDDEFGLAEMAGELLSLRGHSVTTAINGKLALASLEHMRPDVILLDVMMPVMSGPELLVLLRNDDAYREIPVIMMSAAGLESIPEDVRPLVTVFLQKPFTFDELLAALHASLPAS